MFLAEMFFPFSALAATNSCLIIALQIQQIQLLGRSRRRCDLKHKIENQTESGLKFWGEIEG